MSGVFLSTMDSGMVNVALPTAMRDLSISLSQVELVVTVYLMTITVTLVLWGQLADRLGRCNMYLAGMVLFASSSMFCFFTATFHLFLLGRFLQALGAAMMMSSGPAIIKTVFPADKLGRSLGLIGIATAGGLLTGPPVSGILISTYGWKSIFVATLPVSCSFVLYGYAFLRVQFPVSRFQTSEKFDWTGSFCWIVTAVYGMWFSRRIGLDSSSQMLIGGFVLVALVYLFMKIESRMVNPILPLQLLQRRYFWIAVLSAALSFAALFSVLVLFPFYLDYIRQLSPPQIGKIMMAIPASLILLSPLSGYLYDKIGARPLTATGLFISSFSLLGLSSLQPASPFILIVTLLILLGAGQAIFLSPNSASVLSRIEDNYTGVSAGILATARNFGMVSGATSSILLFSVLYGSVFGGHTPGALSSLQEEEFMQALQRTFTVIALLPLTGAILSLFRNGKKL